MRRAKRTMDEIFSFEESSADFDVKDTLIDESADAETDDTQATEAIEPAETAENDELEQGFEDEEIAPRARKKHKISIFWSIFISVFALLTVAVVLFIQDINRLLEDYESARPGYVADDVFEEYFSENNASKIFEKSGFSLSEFETEEHFIKAWNEKIAGEMGFLRVSSDNGGDIVRYNVRSGETTVATFELKLSGETTEHGNPLYAFSSLSVPIKARESVKISAPSQSTVYLNGVAVSQDYKTEGDIPTFCDGHMPEGVAPLVYSVYEVDGLLFQPTVTAVDKDGKTHTLQYDETQKMYVADILYDEDLQAEMGDYVTEAATTFASFMQQGATRSRALSYIEPGTELYQQTQVVNNYWVSAHSGERFDKLEISEFNRYEENTCSCRVSFVHVLTGGTTRFDENGENREYVDITWYYRKVGDQFLIYDRENN